jgi:hypothetical protein
LTLTPELAISLLTAILIPVGVALWKFSSIVTKLEEARIATESTRGQVKEMERQVQKLERLAADVNALTARVERHIEDCRVQVLALDRRLIRIEPRQDWQGRFKEEG